MLPVHSGIIKWECCLRGEINDWMEKQSVYRYKSMEGCHYNKNGTTLNWANGEQVLFLFVREISTEEKENQTWVAFVEICLFFGKLSLSHWLLIYVSQKNNEFERFLVPWVCPLLSLKTTPFESFRERKRDAFTIIWKFPQIPNMDSLES